MRIGVVGTGAMGKNHLRVIDSIPEWTLTCAADINADNLRAACEPYPHIQAFTDYRQMADRVDAVMVSTPTQSHHQIGKFFLDQGKHLMVEKPFALDLEQADELIALAGQKHLTLAVGHLERFNPAIEFIKDIVKKPLFIEIQRLGSFSPRSLDVDVIMDLMIHDLDIILQWDKSGIKQIHAVGVPIISRKVDIANVRIEFNSGLVANITASRVSQKKTRKLRIFQEKQYLSLDYTKRRVKMYELADGQVLENIPEIKEVEPLYNLWYNFYQTIMTGRNYNVTGVDGRNALDLALMVSSSIKKDIAL